MKWANGLMRQRKFSVALTIQRGVGARQSFHMFDKVISTTFRELTVARICFNEMMAIKIRRSQNLFWQMQFPSKLLQNLL